MAGAEPAEAHLACQFSFLMDRLFDSLPPISPVDKNSWTGGSDFMTPSAPDSRNRSPLLPLRASSIPVIYLTVIEQFSVPLLPFLSGENTVQRQKRQKSGPHRLQTQFSMLSTLRPETNCTRARI